MGLGWGHSSLHYGLFGSSLGRGRRRHFRCGATVLLWRGHRHRWGLFLLLMVVDQVTGFAQDHNGCQYPRAWEIENTLPRGREVARRTLKIWAVDTRPILVMFHPFPRPFCQHFTDLPPKIYCTISTRSINVPSMFHPHFTLFQLTFHPNSIFVPLPISTPFHNCSTYFLIPFHLRSNPVPP